MHTKSNHILTLAVILSLLIGFSLSLSAQNTTKKRRKVERFEKGHQFSGGIGAGVSSMNYDLLGGKLSLGIPSITAQFEYTYYFNKTFGLGTGLHFTNYGSVARLTDRMEWTGLKDYQGDTYNHRIDFDDWRERQDMLQLEVPVLIHFKTKPKKVGFHTALGLKLGIPVMKTFNHNRGTLIHSAYYPLWDLTLENIPGRYESEPLEIKQRGVLQNTSIVNAVAYAEMGLMFEVRKKTDITLSIYGNYNINNLSNINQNSNVSYVNGKSNSATPLGFASDKNNCSSFMQPYQGLIGTDHTGTAIHPWSAGLKLGFTHFKVLSEREKQRKAKKLAKQWKEYLPVELRTLVDTIYLEQIVHDTVYYCPDELIPQIVTQRAQQRLDSLLSEAVIWFNFDEYVPILEPADILDKVADMLIIHPNIVAHVNGHACTIGSDQYNQKLALKRAQAVANMLRKKGVRKEQIQVRSFGASEPFRYNKDHQLSKDRRVEIIPEIVAE